MEKDTFTLRLEIIGVQRYSETHVQPNLFSQLRMIHRMYDTRAIIVRSFCLDTFKSPRIAIKILHFSIFLYYTPILT